MRELLHGFNGAHLSLFVVLFIALVHLLVKFHNVCMSLKDANRRLGRDD